MQERATCQIEQSAESLKYLRQERYIQRLPPSNIRKYENNRQPKVIRRTKLVQDLDFVFIPSDICIHRSATRPSVASAEPRAFIYFYYSNMENRNIFTSGLIVTLVTSL
ncbi:hypothetical protein TWF694_001024 [Orbilia ellipsospora]|uniref:Uncharacterized protein n=1 Tax=Orbilia ellipsospora TaxID=2528407 RepID=A0AAV9XQT9_9PEZI